MASELDGRTALVTGASRGLGRAVALALAGRGARVAAVARGEAGLRQTVESIAAGGGEALALVADVGDEESVRLAFERAAKELGSIDILINNAAILGPSEEVANLDPAAWEATYRVNVLGTMLCARAALPAMMQRRYGKIVNVSSGAALVPIAGYSAYSSSKAAVIHLTTCLAEEVRPYGINVNCVGVWARTAMWEEQIATNPMPAVGEAARAGWAPAAEENLGAILFLASPQSDHVTGQYLAANGLPEYAKR
ncbi:MAG: SDR family NAD(P)-dependent oxidoreductase [Chloroflexota bacterium]